MLKNVEKFQELEIRIDQKDVPLKDLVCMASTKLGSINLSQKCRVGM